MCGMYSLKWLDSLITVSLNPEKVNLKSILPEQINYLQSKIQKEKVEQEFFLKSEVFNLLDEKKIRLLINEYHAALIILLDLAFENKKKITDKDLTVKELFNEVIACLDDLLSFVKLRFGFYINPEERVAVTYLSRFRKEVNQKMESIRDELEKANCEEASTILLNFLDCFCESHKGVRLVTFQQLSYTRELLQELETLKSPYHENQIFTKLDTILIYLNFNSKFFINYFIRKIGKDIDALVTIKDKIDHLQLYFKEFNQLNRKPGAALFPQEASLDHVISNWFREELFFHRRNVHSASTQSKFKPEGHKTISIVEKNNSKVLCLLSTDQIAIMLRAIDELQVVKARSMSAVFKTIVPHLSTPYKVDLSYDAVRSKSYAAEESDKKIVIETLQQVIEKVKRY